MKKIDYPLTKLNMTLCILTIVGIILFNMFACTGCASIPAVDEELAKTARTYECDYHTLSFNTKITFNMNGEEYSVTGDFVRILTDPLTMKDSKGNIVGTADDDYNLINQDDHAIIVNGQFEVAIHGNFEVFGESYELYDAEGNKVGYTDFNTFGTSGKIVDNNGTAVALYSKNIMFNDYSVTIYDNNICSDEAILMIVASYASDFHADND